MRWTGTDRIKNMAVEAAEESGSGGTGKRSEKVLAGLEERKARLDESGLGKIGAAALWWSRRRESHDASGLVRTEAWNLARLWGNVLDIGLNSCRRIQAFSP